LFYLDVVYVLHGFHQVFLQVFQMHVSSVSSSFIRMFQVLHLDVSKVDWVLYLASSSPMTASPRCLHLLSASAGHLNQRRGGHRPLPFFSMLAARRGMGHREWRGRALFLFCGSITQVGGCPFYYAIPWFCS
jgi:hypothetical protein